MLDEEEEEEAALEDERRHACASPRWERMMFHTTSCQ